MLDSVKLKNRFELLNEVSNVFKNYEININEELIISVYDNEQNEYLSRMNLTKGIASNSALKENIFVAFLGVMNNIPVFHLR